MGIPGLLALGTLEDHSLIARLSYWSRPQRALGKRTPSEFAFQLTVAETDRPRRDQKLNLKLAQQLGQVKLATEL